MDKCDDLQIDGVFPVRTDIYKNGGIGIEWSGAIGFGQFVLAWGEDGKLHADTEHLDRKEDMRFTQKLLSLLTEQIIIDS